MQGLIAAALILAGATWVPADLPFRFREEAGVDLRDTVPVELTIESGAARVDLLVEIGHDGPRWTRVDGGDFRSGRLTLRAPAGSQVLVVAHPGRGVRAYELDGPFRWPGSPAVRALRPTPRRTLSGTRTFAPGVELRLVGPAAGDGLCESGSALGWQCPAVSNDFTGRIVACDGKDAIAAAEVRRQSTGDVAMRSLVGSAVVRVVTSEPVAEAVRPSARLRRSAGSGGAVPMRDPTWEVVDLGDGLFWLEGESDEAGLVVELDAPRFATERVPVSTLGSVCADPLVVSLVRATPLTGDVADASGKPVAGAVVLARSSEPGREDPVLADALTDEDGAFELPDLEAGPYRVRACHPEHGCRAELSTPGERLRITLDGDAAFTGRVLTSGGVPEPFAHVRIVPTFDAAGRSTDRLLLLPLATVAGGDGRFRIGAPDAGEFLLELRSESSGVARVPVRRSPLSARTFDVGDVRLPAPLELAVHVSGCEGGALSMSGPLGGETSLPSLVRFPLDPGGRAGVRLPEGGAWTAWATCGGRNVTLEPAVLADVSALAGSEVRFEPSRALDDQSSVRSK